MDGTCRFCRRTPHHPTTDNRYTAHSRTFCRKRHPCKLRRRSMSVQLTGKPCFRTFLQFGDSNQSFPRSFCKLFQESSQCHHNKSSLALSKLACCRLPIHVDNTLPANNDPQCCSNERHRGRSTRVPGESRSSVVERRFAWIRHQRCELCMMRCSKYCPQVVPGDHHEHHHPVHYS